VTKSRLAESDEGRERAENMRLIINRKYEGEEELRATQENFKCGAENSKRWRG